MNHFDELYEWDENGNKRRKKRVAGDRERITFATISDQAHGFRQMFADGSPDFTSPHRKGFRFADVNDEAKIAAQNRLRRTLAQDGDRVAAQGRAAGR